MKQYYKSMLKYIILIIAFTQIILANDSLHIYFDNVYKSVQTIQKLARNADNYEKKINELNKQIEDINNDENINWFEKRRVSHLMNEKSEMNNKKLKLYEKIKSHKSVARNNFQEALPKVEKQMDSIITEFESIQDSTKKQTALEKLVSLKSKRDWLLRNRDYFSSTRESVNIAQENIARLKEEIDKNQYLREELVELLQDRIYQLNMMIKAGEEEQTLRSKLNQFSEEMGALSNESFAKAPDHVQTEQTRGANSPGEFYGEYENWEKNTIRNGSDISTDPDNLTKTEYLNYFQNIAEEDLSSSIENLDSLRTLYQNLLQDISKR